jgi:hypothetical protein
MSGLTPTEVLWLAGILEGESCFEMYRESRGVRLCITCVYTDVDVLEAIQRIVGCGSIRRHNASQTLGKPAWKPAYKWQTWKREEELADWHGFARVERSYPDHAALIVGPGRALEVSE